MRKKKFDFFQINGGKSRMKSKLMKKEEIILIENWELIIDNYDMPFLINWEWRIENYDMLFC